MNKKHIHLSGNHFDVCVYGKGDSVSRFENLSRSDAIAVIENNFSVTAVTKITARDRQTGKQTVFTA